MATNGILANNTFQKYNSPQKNNVNGKSKYTITLHKVIIASQGELAYTPDKLIGFRVP